MNEERSNTNDDIYGQIPNINTDTIGTGTRQIEGLTVVQSIPQDSVEDGSYTNYVPKPYGD